MSEGILLFTNDNGGSGSGSNLFDQTSFQDTSLPASNNSGLTDTVGTNPLGSYFGNDLAPKWMAKTLWIRDLVRVEDRSLWINGKPTYKVIWNESFPGANGYLFGDIVSTGTGENKLCLLSGVGDGFGVGGVIRRVQWIFKPSTNLSTVAQQVVDGVNTTTLSVGGLPTADASFTYPPKSVYSAFVHAAANETHDLHDYRVLATQYSCLQVEGVVVYYDIAGDGIECFPGTGYLNKSQVSPSGSSLAFPTGASTFLGGVAGIQFLSQGSFGLTSTMVPSTSSIAIGTINTNLLSLSTGTGASFPVGSAVYVPTGSSYYLGVVSNVSSDVITVGPTLPVGLSGTISQIFKAGASFTIGSTIYKASLDYQPTVQNRGMGSSMLPSPDLLINQSSPYLNWRVWGFTHQFVQGTSLSAGFSTYTDGLSGVTVGLVPSGVSSFLQIDGRFSALETEWMVGLTGVLNASFIIDGLAFTSINESWGSTLAPGLYRRVVFTDAGVGWHSVRMNWAGSSSVALTRVVGYNLSLTPSITLGLLAEIPLGQTFTPRTSAVGSTTLQNGSTTMAWGNIKRIYADSLPHSSTWTFVAGKDLPYAPGGVQLATTTVAESVSFQYFGTQFSIIGNPGATCGVTLDGGVVGPTFNTWLGAAATLGFHSVVVTAQAAAFTTIISAIDFLCPVGEVMNNQNFVANNGYSGLVRSTISSGEPLSPRTGDIWVQDEARSIAYQRAFGGWQRMNLNQPFCYYGTSAAQGITNGPGGIGILFEYRVFDSFGFAGSSGSTLFIIPADGNYLVTSSLRFAAVGSSSLAGSVRSYSLLTPLVTMQLGGFYGASTNSSIPIVGAVIVPGLKRGQTIGTQVGQDSGVQLNTSPGIGNVFFSCQRIGP